MKKQLQRQSKTITRSKALELIYSSNGKFFSTTWIKKDGTERTINGRLKVTKGTKGGKNNATGMGYITMYSMKDKGFKNVDTRTQTELKINGQIYKVK